MSTPIKPLEISKIVKELLKTWWILLSLTISFSTLSYFVTLNYVTPIYRASSTIFIGREGEHPDGLTIADISLDQRLAVDYYILITTGLVLDKTIMRLPANYRNLTIGRNLIINVVPESRFIFISFDDPFPERAALFVNTLSEVLKETSLQIFGVENMNIVDYARTPIIPVRPNIILNTLLAGFLGLLFAAMSVLLKLVYGDSLHNLNIIENELELTVLGVVPKFKKPNVKNTLSYIENLFSSASFKKEFYGLIQISLNYMNIDGNLKVIMFSSSKPDAGKTVSVASIAYVLASSGKKVLLIDCDLRKGTVHSLFNIDRVSGLTNCLAQEMSCTESIKICPTNDNLSILSTGVLPPFPTYVLASNAFENFVKEIKTQYDFVFLHAPSVLPFNDTTLISRISDGIILIAASDTSTRSDLVKAKVLLEKTGTRILGLLLTNVRKSVSRDYYATMTNNNRL